jgi:hypothetical protein
MAVNLQRARDTSCVRFDQGTLLPSAPLLAVSIHAREEFAAMKCDKLLIKVVLKNTILVL